MTKLKTLAFLASAALPLGGGSLPALAATAHNSQAGSWGPNSHQCDATPYFEADPACFPADLFNSPIGATLPPPAAYRRRRAVSLLLARRGHVQTLAVTARKSCF